MMRLLLSHSSLGAHLCIRGMALTQPSLIPPEIICGCCLSLRRLSCNDDRGLVKLNLSTLLSIHPSQGADIQRSDVIIITGVSISQGSCTGFRMVLSCSCFEACCSPAKAPSSSTPVSVASAREEVVPDVSATSNSYSVPSAPSENDIAFFNAPKGIMATFANSPIVGDLRTKTLVLLSVSKATVFGVSYLLKCQVSEPAEIIHVKCWSSAVGRLVITGVLRNMKKSDALVPF